MSSGKDHIDGETTMDYEEIKQEAKERKEPIENFLALSPGNDPFYVGSPGQLQKAQWFAMVYKKMGSPTQCHVRRVHYWLVSQNVPKPDGTRYENTLNDWGFVTIASKYARYAGLIPIENIIDRRNPAPIVNAHNWSNDNPTQIKEDTDKQEIINNIVDKFYCYNPSNTQAYMLEMWCEKSTMNDVLEPIAKKYGMNLITGLGELSITAVHQLIDRIQDANKPTRIFYISDFDPAGECMPVSVARKIEFLLKENDVDTDVKLMPIMLTATQCRKYKLPRTPIKPTERRKDGFEERHGAGATELDALEALMPGEMKRVIESKVLEYFDIDKWNEASNLNREIRSKVRDFLQDKIGNALEELDLTDFDDVELEVAEVVDDSSENWLFDNELDYFEQLNKYKEHQSQGQEK